LPFCSNWTETSILSSASGRRSGDAGSRKATRHPRKEYPNVMGISLAEWLARQP